MLRHVLLALLADGTPRHGYALMKAYAARAGLRLSIGNVYRELQRLVAEGLVAVAPNPEGADPRRTPYAITARGRAVLAAWLDTPADSLMTTGPDPLAYRLAILGDLDPRSVAVFLEELDHELEAEARRIERERTTVLHRHRGTDRVARTRALLLGRRVRHLAVEQEMLDEMRHLLATPARAARLARGVAERPPSPRRRRGESRPERPR
jgi:DNA-binding PadR family transcriptional regulator